VQPTDPDRLSRSGGPDTSREAADGHVNSGVNLAQKRLILGTVLAHPGSTVDEIAAVVGMLQHKVGKRLSDLERTYFIRKGEPRKGLSGRNMTTWWPTELATDPE
jgi:predicted ArsR family transcriptional regulator